MLRTAVCLALAVPLAAQGWVDATPVTGPAPQHGEAMCYDAGHSYSLMFGWSGGGSTNTATWSWNGTAWTSRGSAINTGGSPSDHSVFALAYHPPTGLPVLVAQYATYTWDGTNWTLRTQLPAIAGNCDYAMAFDPTRGQMVLFAGFISSQGQLPSPANDTLLWDGFGWTVRQPVVRPNPTCFPHMAFDPVAGKLLLATSDLNHTQTYFWEWNGSNWSQRIYATEPTMTGPMVTDTVHNIVTMFDGVVDPNPNHTWTFANGVNSRLGLTSEPTHRCYSAGTFDPVRSRFVLFGGSTSYAPSTLADLGDTWEFDLGASASFTAYGAGCAGSRGTPTLAPQNNTLPHVGRTLELHVGDLPFTSPVFVFLGISNTTYGPTPLPFSLAGLGAPGCSVVSSCEAVLPLTNVLGSAVWQLAVPNMPGVTFYTQAVVLDGAANALGITTSNGGQNTIGF
jgi:hypothetical protein